jgi:molybdate transport system permease protein
VSTGSPRPGSARRGRGPAVGRVPLLLVVPAAVAVAFLLLPLVALATRTPLATLPDQLRSAGLRQALLLSLETSTAAMVVVTLVGVPLAWLLARVTFRGRSLLRLVVTIPLVLPPVVAGVALLTAFGRRGLIGGPVFETFGVTIPFSTAAVVIAHAFVALPFFVISVEGALRSTNAEYDVVAATLGATRWTVFRRVTLPMAMPGVFAGLVLGWARSLGEFGATITFAGNFPGTTQTMPLLVYSELQHDQDAAIVVGEILLVVSVAVLALLRDRWFHQVAP